MGGVYHYHPGLGRFLVELDQEELDVASAGDRVIPRNSSSTPECFQFAGQANDRQVTLRGHPQPERSIRIGDPEIIFCVIV